MNKVIVIGGGISGLSAGIFALKKGYEVTIIEKNPITGGECMGWYRKGYYIDNCVHYLFTGPKDSSLYNLWKEVGVIDDSIAFINEEYLYAVEIEGRTYALYSSLEKTRKELLEIAFEDKEELELFFKAVEDSRCIVPPTSKPIYKMNLFELMRLGKEYKPAQWIIKKYGKLPIKQFAYSFKNKKIQILFSSYFSEIFTAQQLIVAYGFLVHRNASIITKGSLAISQRMTKRFKDLGGKLLMNSQVNKILIEKNKAKGVLLENGKEITGDYLIPAIDFNYLYSNLLPKEYFDKKLRKQIDDNEDYKILTSFHIVFGIKGKEEIDIPKGSFIFDIHKLNVADKEYHQLGTRLYDQDPSLYPLDKRVIQVIFMGDDNTYFFFKKLSEKTDDYKRYKNDISLKVQEILEEKFVSLKDRLVLIDTYSPTTYERYCNAYHGSYMAFYPQNGKKAIEYRNTVKKLKNVFLASQWLSSGGGLPFALINGKFAADNLKKVS